MRPILGLASRPHADHRPARSVDVSEIFLTFHKVLSGVLTIRTFLRKIIYNPNEPIK